MVDKSKATLGLRLGPFLGHVHDLKSEEKSGLVNVLIIMVNNQHQVTGTTRDGSV